MTKLVFIPFFCLLVFLSGCQSSRLTGDETAAFDGKETRILSSR